MARACCEGVSAKQPAPAKVRVKRVRANVRRFCCAARACATPCSPYFAHVGRAGYVGRLGCSRGCGGSRRRLLPACQALAGEPAIAIGKLAPSCQAGLRQRPNWKRREHPPRSSGARAPKAAARATSVCIRRAQQGVRGAACPRGAAKRPGGQFPPTSTQKIKASLRLAPLGGELCERTRYLSVATL